MMELDRKENAMRMKARIAGGDKGASITISYMFTVPGLNPRQEFHWSCQDDHIIGSIAEECCSAFSFCKLQEVVRQIEEEQLPFLSQDDIPPTVWELLSKVKNVIRQRAKDHLEVAGDREPCIFERVGKNCPLKNKEDCPLELIKM